MAWIDMELVKGPELRSIIEALNGSGLLAEPIDLKKGRRVAKLADEFVAGIEAINTMGKLDDVPEAVFNYYVAIVKEGEPPDAAAKKAEADKKKAEAAAKRKAAAEKKKAAEEAKAAKEAEKTAAAEAKKEEKKAAAEEKKAAAKKPPAKKATAKKAPAKKPPAKKAPAKKPVMVKAAVFGKLLLSKKTKKWDVVELVTALAEKTGSTTLVDTRRKCNTYIALLRTMGVLEDAGDKLVMAEWYRKALAAK